MIDRGTTRFHNITPDEGVFLGRSPDKVGRPTSPIARTVRPELADSEDEEILAQAEKSVIEFLIDRGVDKVEARTMVGRLSDKNVRHDIQTILDLTPTKQ